MCPLLFILYTHDCIPTHSSNAIVRFADTTTVVGLISGEDAYREGVQWLLAWSSENNLILNTSKTKELVNFRKNKPDIQPIYTNNDYVERVSDFKFLYTHNKKDLTWFVNPTVLFKKAHQRLSFLRMNNLAERLLLLFYCRSIKSVLCHGITLWFASCSTAERKVLQRVIDTAQKLSRCPLPSLEDIYRAHCLRRAQNIVRDPSHSGHYCLNCCLQGGTSGTLKPKQTDLRTVFIAELLLHLILHNPGLNF